MEGFAGCVGMLDVACGRKGALGVGYGMAVSANEKVQDWNSGKQSPHAAVVELRFGELLSG